MINQIVVAKNLRLQKQYEDYLLKQRLQLAEIQMDKMNFGEESVKQRLLTSDL
jgi:hypothetical protein